MSTRLVKAAALVAGGALCEICDSSGIGGIGASAAAQNLFLNGDLDSGLTGWSFPDPPNTGTLEEGADSDGCAGSVSIEADSVLCFIAEQPAECSSIGQCFARPAGLGAIRVQARYQQAGASFQVLVMAFASPGCPGTETRFAASPFYPSTAGDWASLAFQTSLLAGTQSIEVWLIARSDFMDPHVLKADRLYAGEDERVHADDFESGDSPPCRWSSNQP